MRKKGVRKGVREKTFMSTPTPYYLCSSFGIFSDIGEGVTKESATAKPPSSSDIGDFGSGIGSSSYVASTVSESHLPGGDTSSTGGFGSLAARLRARYCSSICIQFRFTLYAFCSLTNAQHNVLSTVVVKIPSI